MPGIMQTPPERFTALPGFPWPAHRRDDLQGYSGLAMSYLDEGAQTAPVFLCLHGQPTWSYLYRRMIPHFIATGARVVAPDFFGFGRSDKPEDEGVYTFDFHRNSLLALVRSLDLTDVTLVVQDWGGLLGLTLPMEMPERFSRLIVMNTALPTGETPLPQGFLDWRAFCNSQPDMAVGRLMARACPHLSPAEAAAYDAPLSGRALQSRRAPLSESGAGISGQRRRRDRARRARLLAQRLERAKRDGDRHEGPGARAAGDARTPPRHPLLSAAARIRRGRTFRPGMGR